VNISTAWSRGTASCTNAIFAAILAIGFPTLAYRYWNGMGAVSNLSQTNPWGIWVSINILCGIALAAGGYTVAATVYVFGLKQYRPILRPAILTGFLGYVCAICGLIVELGQPRHAGRPHDPEGDPEDDPPGHQQHEGAHRPRPFPGGRDGGGVLHPGYQ